MGRTIRKAAVIGSGTMGGGIAALLAGVGVETILLDIAARDSQPGDPPDKRNVVVNEGLKRVQSSRPPQLFAASDLGRIRTGNLEDDLGLLADADWVVEVVVERLDVKRALMATLAEVVGPETILSTNTSGLPIRAIAEGLGEAFSRRFLGTHFFNPPRYLKLLEIIPHPNTAPEVVETMVQFATWRLGKGVVIARDEPNFIGNRLMSMTVGQTINNALEQGLTVDEVDSLTGPLVGRPRTATFRLYDLVGLDIAAGIARTLYEAIPHDEARDVLKHPTTEALFDRLLQNNWLGNKTGQGFYKVVKGEDGSKEFWTLDPDTLAYRPPTRPQFESVTRYGKVADTGERIRLLVGADDRAGRFLRDHFAFYLAYASRRVPEITETLVNVDNAQKWGFGHELGPFEIWDALGVAQTIPQFEAAGYPIAEWVRQMVATGHPTFYQRDASGQVTGYYSPQQGTYVPLEEDRQAVSIGRLHAADRVLAGNASASVLDLGDGVALLEFHSKDNTIEAETLEMAWRALDLLQRDFDGLVIGNAGASFSTGASLFQLTSWAQAGQFDDLNALVKNRQDVIRALRHAAKPVIAAVHGAALNAGAEIAMASFRTVAHMELTMGLTAANWGLIPATGGCLALLLRVVNPVMQASAEADALPHLRIVFKQIMGGRVSGSASEAREMGYLTACDRIIMNRDHLLGQAKRAARYHAEGYTPVVQAQVWAAGPDAFHALIQGLEADRDQGRATDYDVDIGRKLAYVLTGGPVEGPGWVDEEAVLKLEREAFMDLVRDERTRARMASTLAGGKPARP